MTAPAKHKPIGCAAHHFVRQEGTRLVCMYCRTITGHVKKDKK